jgi:hypothetical protein
MNKRIYDGYQPRSNLLKDENGDLLVDCLKIFGRWRNNFSQLLNVHSFSDDRQKEIHTAEPFEVKTAAAKAYFAKFWQN